MEPSAKVRALAKEREAARIERDFIRADAVRDELASLGWRIRDGADGSQLEPIPRAAPIDPARAPDHLTEPVTRACSVQLVHEGFIEDLARFVRALVSHHDLREVETIVVDPATGDAEAIAELLADVPGASVILLDRDPGWGAARNVAIRASSGAVSVFADLSIEPTGDVLTPLMRAFQDPGVAVAGPIGVVTTDLFTWSEAATGTCDAIEGYLLATRRDLLRDAGLVDERFTWYRNADLALSLQLRDAAAGGAARQVEVPFRKHQHRGYLRFEDDAVRDRMSRRNYNLLLERWRDATHLLTGAPARG